MARSLILMIPQPAAIQAQPEGERKGGATQNQFASTLKRVWQRMPSPACSIVGERW